MFEIEKIFTFEAGHSLPHHDGICKNPHGHSYVLKVRLRSSELISSGPKVNMVMDFGDLSKVVVKMLVKYLDHQWLNDSLNVESPTAEYIAKWIFDYLKPQLPLLHSIALNETASSTVTYTPSN
jgi:6-pyruvoyltetrahydropterin/6-carboxytetrahydropterin synthase